MAKKKHSSGSNKSSSQKPLEQKTTQQDSTRTAPPFKTLTPPSPKSSSSSDSHPKKMEPTPPSNSMNQTSASAAAAAAANSSNRPRKRLFTKNLLSTDSMKHFSLFYNSFSVKPRGRKLRKRILKLKHRFQKKVKNGKSPTKENVVKKPMPEESMYSQEEFVKGECSYQMGYACIDMNVLNRLMESIEGSEKEELERRWKELKHQELKLFVEECELVKETNRLILEAWRGSS